MIVVVFTLAGIALLLRGRAGRRINDHPVCRRCRFDLFGLEPRTRCPECANDVSSPSAVRIGQRMPLFAHTLAGVLSLIVAVVVLGGALSGRVTRANLVRFEPDWLLVAQADGWLCNAEPIVLDELLRRIDARTLANHDIAKLASRALAVQSSAARAWDQRWGDLFVHGHLRDLVSDQERAAFLTRCVASEFKARERVRQWSVSTIKFDHGLLGARLPRCTILGARAHPLLTSGAELRWKLRDQHSAVMWGSRRSTPALETMSSDHALEASLRCDDTLGYKANPGTYTLEAEMRVSLAFEDGRARALDPRVSAQSLTAFDTKNALEVVVRRERRVVVLRQGAEEPALVTSQAMAQTLREHARMGFEFRALTSEPKSGDIGLFLTFRPAKDQSHKVALPLPWSYTVVMKPSDELHHDHQARPTSNLDLFIVQTVLDSSETHTTIVRAPKPDVTHVDVYLFPIREGIEQQAEGDCAWDGVVIYRRVPFRYNQETTHSPTRVESPVPSSRQR